MNKILKSAVLSGSILAMALTPGLILSTQDNQQTEYREVTKESQSKQTKEGSTAFDPIIVNFNLTESEGVLSSEVNSERKINFATLAVDKDPYEDEEPVEITWERAFDWNIDLDYEIDAIKGVRINKVTFRYKIEEYNAPGEDPIAEPGHWIQYSQVQEDYSLEFKYIPQEVIEGGVNEINKFSSNQSPTVYAYDDKWLPYSTDGSEGMYIQVTPTDFEDFMTPSVNPIILHLTWPSKYNMEDNYRNKFDLYYENYDSGNKSADLYFRSKYRNFFRNSHVDRSLIKKAGRLSVMIDDTTLSTIYKEEDSSYTQINILNDQPDIFDYIQNSNVITSIYKFSDFDLLSEDTAKIFDSNVGSPTDSGYYYYLDTETTITRYVNIEENIIGFTTDDEYYDYISTIANDYFDTNYVYDPDGYKDYHLIEGQPVSLVKQRYEYYTQPIGIVSDENGDRYLTYKVWLDFDESYGEGENHMSKWKEFVNTNVSETEFNAMIENFSLHFPIDIDIPDDTEDWSSEEFEDFVSIDLKANDKNKENFTTPNEIFVIVLSILSILLLVLMILLLIRRGMKEDKTIEITSSKGGAK